LEERDRPDTLPAEIAQINNQWGSFRDVNEDVLRTKIAEEDKGDLDEDEDGQDASELDSTERLEQLYKRRKDIIDFAT
jgi:mediator of RNA polymerase II transcription subunit 17